MAVISIGFQAYSNVLAGTLNVTSQERFRKCHHVRIGCNSKNWHRETRVLAPDPFQSLQCSKLRHGIDASTQTVGWFVHQLQVRVRPKRLPDLL